MKKVSFGESREFVEKEVKSNTFWAFLRYTIYVVAIVILLFWTVEVQKIMVGEDTIKTILDMLSASGMASIDYNRLMYWIYGLIFFGGAIFILFEMIALGDHRLLFEEDKIIYVSKGTFKSSKIMKYSEIVRVRYKPVIFNVGDLILETYNVKEPIVIHYVHPLNKNFEDVKEIITKHITSEIGNKLQEVSSEPVEQDKVKSVVGLLQRGSVKKEEVVNTLINVSQNKTDEEKKNLFKIILLELVRTRRIGRDTLNEVIKDLKNKGVLNMNDIGELVDLKFETEEKYLGL